MRARKKVCFHPGENGLIYSKSGQNVELHETFRSWCKVGNPWDNFFLTPYDPFKLFSTSYHALTLHSVLEVFPQNVQALYEEEPQKFRSYFSYNDTNDFRLRYSKTIIEFWGNCNHKYRIRIYYYRLWSNCVQERQYSKHRSWRRQHRKL